MNKIKKIFDKMNAFFATSLSGGLIGTVIFLLLIAFNSAFASWGEAIMGLSFLFTILGIFDVLVLRSVNLIEELKNGNMAISIFLSAIVIAYALLSGDIVGGGTIFKLG